MKKLQSAILIVLMLSSTLTVLSSSFSLVHGASNALWCNILYGGLKYDVYVSSDPQISDPHDRALSFLTDSSAITNIYAMENAGPIVVDAKLKQLLVLDAQNLGRFTKNIDSVDDMSALSLSDFSEETRNDNDNNQYLIAPPSATTDFFKRMFIYRSWVVPFKIDGTDDYDHRVDMWKEVILDAVLQADLYKTNHLNPQLVEQLSRVLHGLGLSLTISEMILKGSHTFSLKPTEVQTTLFNYQQVSARTSMLKNLGKLSAILGAFTAGVDVYADVMQMFILGSLANAAAEERLSALEDFIQQNEGSLDVALVSGIVKAREGFDEIIKTYYDGVQNLMRSVQKNAINIALAIASLAASFSSSALSSFLLPFALDYEAYSYMRDQTYKMQRLSLAAALQRILSTKPSVKGLSFLRDELKNTEYKDHDKLEAALNLFCVDNYLGFYFYKNYYEVLNVPIYKQIENWWTGGVLDEALNYYSSRATTQSQIVTWVQPDAFMARWPERNWDDLSWLLQKAALELPFHVEAESAKQWYKIGDTTTTTITVTNCRNVATAYWITVRFMDSRETPTMYIPTSVDPATITLDPGKSTQHVVYWKIPESVPQGSYRMSVDLWTDVDYKEEYLDDMGWKTVFSAYKLVILTPTAERPVYVDTTMNSGSILVAAYLDAPFLPYSSFDIDIGGKNAEFKQALTFIQDPFYWLELLGIYTFQVTPPTQETQGPFDLNIAINYNEIVDSAAQTNAVIYQESLGPIEKGLAWLRTAQLVDGSWDSSVGITSLAALAFINSGYGESDQTVSKALSYIMSNVKPDGSIYSSYADYETSIAILPLVATHNYIYSQVVENARTWLVNSQWDEGEGITKDDPYYGGFGYGENIRPDLSNTQWALMGLDAAGLPQSDLTWKKAQIFLARCQNRHATVTIDFGDGTSFTVQPYDWQSNDGGFIYLPGGSLAGGTISYGSMTMAGVWSLRLCGVDVNDPRLKGDGTIKGGLDWIADHYLLDSNPGMPSYDAQRFVYYYYLTLSKALTMAQTKIIGGHDWYQDLSSKLGSQYPDGLQYPDGHWVSSYWGHGEEYIPELATAYSILALQTRSGAVPTQRLSYLTFILRSNCLIRVIDSEGNLVGYNYMTGIGEDNIPTAVYSGPFYEPQYVVIVNPKPETYKLELVGISEGPYTLTIQGSYGEEVTDTFIYSGEIKPAELHGSEITVAAIVGPVDIYANPPEFEEIIDTTPPTTTFAIGNPQYTDGAGKKYITSVTSLTLTAEDNVGGTGVASTRYRMYNTTGYDTGLIPSTPPIEFHLTGIDDGEYSIDFYSVDNIGNIELTTTQNVILDNTPPTTTPTIGDPKYVSGRTYITPDTPFALDATDTGSGVKLVTYRINSTSYDSGWLTYAKPFNLTSLGDGNYTIAYNSTDNVGNLEATHQISITLFSWNFVFKDSDGRGTTLKVNTAYKFFQFITPNKDFGVKYAAKMTRLCKQVLVMCYEDKVMRLIATAVDDETCLAVAWDRQTCKAYWLIEHPPVYKLTVCCKDADGKAISSASVYLNGCCQGQTDSNGNLIITNVFSGTYTVTVKKCGYKDSSSAVTVTSDATLTLTMTPQTYTLTVFCKDSKGKAVSGASVYINGNYQGVTDSRGKLAITNITAGTCTVTAKKGGYKDTSVDVTVTGDKTITIIMK